jgi:hypothetical protein
MEKADYLGLGMIADIRIPHLNRIMKKVKLI